MRFYDPSTDPPNRLDSAELFPNADEETAAIRCLKMGLVPSVTAVLDTFREEYLEKFKIKEGIRFFQERGDVKAALNAVYHEDSPNSSFGTQCHAISEAVLLKTLMPEVPELVRTHAAPLVRWLEKNVYRTIHAEIILASSLLGSAGTVDMVFETIKGEMVVGDIKVVKFSTKFPPKPSLAYRCQLSAYAKMLEEKYDRSFQRWSFYLASPFGWDKHPKLRIFRHTMDYLPTFQAARLIWETKLQMEELSHENFR